MKQIQSDARGVARMMGWEGAGHLIWSGGLFNKQFAGGCSECDELDREPCVVGEGTQGTPPHGPRQPHSDPHPPPSVGTWQLEPLQVNIGSS